ncbi:hypothetical protein Hanom_Chr05g00455041 [Helianthus anomalus]
MKISFFSHKILAAIFLCCLIATMKAAEISTKSLPEREGKNHHQPKKDACLRFRCRLLNEGPLPPPILSDKSDVTFSIEKRLVPGGPNPLHN